VVAIGGPLGPSYWVRWDAEEKALRYRSEEDPEVRAAEEALVRPDEAAWERFWAALDGVEVWSWDERYEDPDVLDGTGWFLEIAAGGRRVASSGRSAYPGGRGAGDPGPDFLRLCAEVSALLGRRPFR
jgi:hypothetical protein